jgi:hypothetical protein
MNEVTQANWIVSQEKKKDKIKRWKFRSLAHKYHGKQT